MNRIAPITSHTGSGIGHCLKYTADEMSLLADRFTDAVAKLETGCDANSKAMIRSAHLSISDIFGRVAFLNEGLRSAIEKDTAR